MLSAKITFVPWEVSHECRNTCHVQVYLERRRIELARAVLAACSQRPGDGQFGPEIRDWRCSTPMTPGEKPGVPCSGEKQMRHILGLGRCSKSDPSWIPSQLGWTSEVVGTLDSIRPISGSRSKSARVLSDSTVAVRLLGGTSGGKWVSVLATCILQSDVSWSSSITRSGRNPTALVWERRHKSKGLQARCLKGLSGSRAKSVYSFV